MEFPRLAPGRRALLIAAALVVAAVVAVLLLRRHRPSGPDFVAGHAYAVPPMEGRIQVEVLNATDRNGLARTATRALRRAGVDVVFFGTAGTERDSSVVLIRRGERAAGDSVARVLGIALVRSAPDTLRRVDVTVLLGADFQGSFPLHP